MSENQASIGLQAKNLSANKNCHIGGFESDNSDLDTEQEMKD